MAKLSFVGSSNIRNTFSGKLKQLERIGKCTVEYISATSITAGYKALKDVRDTTILVIGFLLNGITDTTELCKNEEEIHVQMSATIEQYCQAILESATSKPDCKHYVITPFYRSSPKWLAAELTNIGTVIKDKLSHTMAGIHVIPAIDFAHTDLHDEVHLNVDAQNRLYSHIINSIFPTSMEVDSTAKRARSPSPTPTFASPQIDAANPASGPSSNARAAKISKIGDDVGKEDSTPVNNQGSGLDEGATTDDGMAAVNKKLKVHGICLKAIVYQSANQADITDSLINTNNLNQVIVSGIPDGCFGLGWSPKVKEVVQKIVGFTKVHPGAIETAIPQQYPIPKHGKLPDLKIIFNSPQAGLLFRQQANTLRKDKADGWAGIYVSNVATKSTHVRVALLQSIAKVLQRLPANEGRIVMVNKYDTRPQLCFKTGDKITKRLFYIDAIQKYETLISSDAIALARKIAGKSFGVRLDPIFVVL